MNNNIRGRFDKKERVVANTDGESLTQQHMKNDSDINVIVARYMKTGVLGNPNATRKPIFGDFSSHDYMGMRNAIADMDQNFSALSARLRRRFNNDVYQLVRFVENPENTREALRLGLLGVPDGYEVMPDGSVVEQQVLKAEEPVVQKESVVVQKEAVQRPDSEAQPSHRGSRPGGSTIST